MKMVTEKNQQKTKSSKGLVKGEWIVLLAIFAITGLTTFFYTQNKLSESDDKTVTEITVETPTPAPEKTETL